MSEKIVVKKLTKIFGKRSKEILKRLAKNQSKEQIFKETGYTVGVKRCLFCCE